MAPVTANTDYVTVQICSDQLAAEVLANALRAQSVPVIVRGFGGIPGLEQGTEVRVPATLLHRAKWIIAQPAPSEEELTFLATGKLPGNGDSDG